MTNSNFMQVFEKIQERKEDLKRFLKKAPTAFLPPILKDIVRDAIDSFYPSKEEELIVELKELTSEKTEEIMNLLELTEEEFSKFFKLFVFSIYELQEDHQELKNDHKRMEEKVDQLHLKIDSTQEKDITSKLCRHFYNLIMEGEMTKSDKLYVAVSETFSKFECFLADNRYFLKDVFEKEDFIRIEQFYNDIYNISKMKNRIFNPESTWDKEKTIWKSLELSELFRGQIEIREKTKSILETAEELFKDLCSQK